MFPRAETASGSGPALSPNAGALRSRLLKPDGIVLNLKNPSEGLLGDMLEAAGKPFIVSGLARASGCRDRKTHQREERARCASAWDAAAPDAVSAKLIDMKRMIGDSDNLLLTTQQPGPSALSEMGLPDGTARPGPDEAKQKMYLALIKDGWTKDEIYATVGVSPARSGQMQMPPPGAGRLGGNLARLSQ